MSEFIDLNKFTKLVKIGEGSFGKVFKVIEKETKNIYAAKISFSKLDESNHKFIKSLKRELAILSFDFHSKSYPVIITEYSSNGSLYDIINQEKRSITPKNWMKIVIMTGYVITFI